MHNCHLEFPQPPAGNDTGEATADDVPRPGLRLLTGGLVTPAPAIQPEPVVPNPIVPVQPRRRMPVRSRPASLGVESLPIDVLVVQCDRWLRDCRRCNQTAPSMAMNQFIVDKLLWYLRREGWDECNQDALEAFLLYISDEGHREPLGRWEENTTRSKRPLSRRSNKTYFLYLTILFNWFVRKQILELSPMRLIDPPLYQEDQQVSFTPEELDALLNAAEASRQGRRNLAILLTLLDTGLRESEFCALKIGDVDLDEGRIQIINGKGQKDREAYIERGARGAIYDYLAESGRDPERDKHEPLWLGERGGVLGDALRPTGLLSLFHRLGRVAGLRTRCHPHKMRRTFATDLLDSGTTPRYVQRLLGHSTLKMTMAYHYAAEKRVREDHRANSPADRLLAGRKRKRR